MPLAVSGQSKRLTVRATEEHRRGLLAGLLLGVLAACSAPAPDTSAPSTTPEVDATTSLSDSVPELDPVPVDYHGVTLLPSADAQVVESPDDCEALEVPLVVVGPTDCFDAPPPGTVWLRPIGLDTKWVLDSCSLMAIDAVEGCAVLGDGRDTIAVIGHDAVVDYAYGENARPADWSDIKVGEYDRERWSPSRFVELLISGRIDDAMSGAAPGLPAEARVRLRAELERAAAAVAGGVQRSATGSGPPVARAIQTEDVVVGLTGGGTVTLRLELVTSFDGERYLWEPRLRSVSIVS